MAIGFTAPYQSIYEAGTARIQESAARKRAAASRGSARAGVRTSGVSRIPQGAIGAEELRSEADLAANLAQQQEGERLMERRAVIRKELLRLQGDISAAAEARRAALERELASSGRTGRLGGAGLAARGTFAAGKRGEE